MPLNNPQVQIARKVEQGENDKVFLYAITHFQTTDYKSDGHEAVSEPEDGVLTVNLKVIKDGEWLRLNNPVSHQVSLDNIDLTTVDTVYVVVKENNSPLASTTIVYQDETETVVKPLRR